MDKSKIKLPLIIIILTLGILLGTQIQKVFSGDGLFENLKKFNDVISLTQKYYLEDVEVDKMVENAINGMLEKLDPHSVYIPVKQMQTVEEEFRGDFEGIGVEFQIVNDTLTVVSPITGGPSEALGIMAGDRIIKIDTKDAIGITNDEVRKQLRGPKGTKVKVLIVRPGVTGTIEYEITRDKIPLYSVDTHIMINRETGYVSVTRFGEKTTEELKTALYDLQKQGMKQLILDLRNNPGGYLNQAVQIADLFIAGDKKIVYTRGRKKEFDEDFFAGKTFPFEKTPVIVLINRGSASASEIVSGAIQDWDRGLIVGETSFGKGLVQRQYPLQDGSALRLTISEYFTPMGRFIQRKYDNKKEYYEDLAEREETEGENLTHDAESDSGRPVFKTNKGRNVYGGGGITPDYISKSEKLTEYSTSLLRKNVFYLYTLKYLDAKGDELKKKYAELIDFNDKFKISEKELKEFIEFAKEKDVEFKSEDYEKDKAYIMARIKAQIARNYWKNEGWYMVLLGFDNQITKSLSLFNKAKEMANN
ncbi:MAG: S41 family peptidase [Ignavibacteriaceae bacterium]